MTATEQKVAIEAIDAIGRGRIRDARNRLKGWDGVTWRVTQLPVPDATKMHVRPDTDGCVDWLCFWVKSDADPHVRVRPI